MVVGNPLRLDELTNRAKKEKLARLLLERIRRLADNSFFYFVKYVLGYEDLEFYPHYAVCRFVQRYAWRQDCLILLPRGTFKSTIVSVGYPLWRFTKNRELRILLDSVKRANTVNWLGVISRHIEGNELFRALYGDLKGKDRWHSQAIALGGRKRYAAEDSVTATSLETTKVSQHYDLYIGDDLQTDENIASKEMVDQVEEHISLLTPIVDPQRDLGGLPGPKILVGTRWADGDVYGRIVARERLGRARGEGIRLRILQEKAAEKVSVHEGRFVLHGKLFFPARFNAEVLNRIQGTMSMYQFSCQYLNDPIPDATAIFKKACLNLYNSSGCLVGKKLLPVPRILNQFCLIDPSLGESADSDYTAFVVVGVDAESNLYVTAVQREHLLPDQIIDRMFEVWRTYKVYRMGVEEVGFQRTLALGFNRRARELGEWFRVELLRTDHRKTKVERISGFQPFVSAGKVFLRVREEIPLTSDRDLLFHSLVEGQDVLFDEMVRFPRGVTVDCLDALAYAPQLVFPAGTPLPPKPTAATYEDLYPFVRREDRQLGGERLREIR